MAGKRLGARRLLGEQQTFKRHPFLKIAILGRKGDVDPARDHADRAVPDRALVHRGVDPARQPGHDRCPGLCQAQGKLAGEAAGRSRRVACADHRNTRAMRQGQIASHDQHRGRRLQLGEQRRIGGIAEKQVPCPQLCR